jgi:hypothetical protein
MKQVCEAQEGGPPVTDCYQRTSDGNNQFAGHSLTMLCMWNTCISPHALTARHAARVRETHQDRASGACVRMSTGSMEPGSARLPF